ncbi:MAG: EAL domain-containing protein [Azoarcus sp.]|jgi:lactose/cellobiose-specific phosphotransferase system IIC component|nr:EAL domain-containing protein [Azoarcus sp.]
MSATSLIDRLQRFTTPRWAFCPAMMSIRNGFLLCLPLVVAGALAIVLNNLPIQAYQDAMSRLFGDGWTRLGAAIWQGTFGILSLPALLGTSYHLTQSYNQRHPTRPVSSPIAAMVALASFLAVTPLTGQSGDLSIWLGVQGLFISVVIALTASRLLIFLCGIERLRMTIYSEGLDISIPSAFICLIPGVLTITCFAGVHLVFLSVTGMTVHECVYAAMLYPITFFTDILNTSIAYVLLIHVNWFFGIHGSNVFAPLSQEILEQTNTLNAAALAAGLSPPYPINKHTLDIFVFMGGAGSSLCLIAALLMASRNRNSRRLAKISLAPGLLNINEVLLYGLPLVLNPVFLLPFLLVPLALMLITYLALGHGLVPWPSVVLDWTTPPLLSGYLATGGSWRGPILQAINLLAGFLIYLPFVKISDRIKDERQKNTLGRLMEVACSNLVGPSGKKCIDRSDDIGVLARVLASDLDEAIRRGADLYLEYQPLVDYRTNRVTGAEALLRWRHPIYGLIPAPITVAISEDAGFMQRIGMWVLDQACIERERWHQAGLEPHFKISVNVSIQQLSDPLLPEKIVQCVERRHLRREMIGIEVTESIALDPESPHNFILKRINDLGFIISMDDFGMGHSSLSYLKYFPVNILKIDKALSKDVASSRVCAEIIATIVELCQALNIRIVVEFVENPEQIEVLLKLGCHVFQGYFFSPPLSPAKTLAYTLDKNGVLESPPTPPIQDSVHS